MRKPLHAPPGRGNAKGVAGLSPDQGASGDQLSPRLEAEIHGALARSLQAHKAETIAAECNVDRATIYKWAAKPARVPAAVLDVLAAFDPDPEFLSRVAGHLLAAVTARALTRQAQGQAIAVFHNLNGRWVR